MRFRIDFYWFSLLIEMSLMILISQIIKKNNASKKMIEKTTQKTIKSLFSQRVPCSNEPLTSDRIFVTKLNALSTIKRK
jgi:hypothetical protein